MTSAPANQDREAAEMYVYNHQRRTEGTIVKQECFLAGCAHAREATAKEIAELLTTNRISTQLGEELRARAEWAERQLQFTNSNWLHEKKLHDELTAAREKLKKGVR